MCEALLIYKSSYFSTVGKRILESSGKFYAIDLGIRNSQDDFKI
jgi:hypothetical protein